MNKIFDHLDSHSKGYLTWEEFLQGMQIVCDSACMDACSQDGPGWSLDACQRDKLAIFELNLTWHGIGDWLR